MHIDNNTTTSFSGVLIGEFGKITTLGVSRTTMAQIVYHAVHNVLRHGVTENGGFYGGENSRTDAGVAIGKNATTQSLNSSFPITAIQIGTGNNPDPNTMQVMNYKLLDALGKIPEDRLPPYRIELDVVEGYLSWRYEGQIQWNQLINIADLQGEDGQIQQVDSWGPLTEQIIIDTQNEITTGRYIYYVTVDNRIDMTLPASLNGDKTGWLIGYNGDIQEWTELSEAIGIQGPSGKQVELRNNGTRIQWKYDGDPTWLNLIELSELKGDKGDTGEAGTDGREVTFRNNGTHIQWKYSTEPDANYISLVALSALTGAQGDAGLDGEAVELRVSSDWLQWKYVSEGIEDWKSIYNLINLQGDPGLNPEFQFNATHLQYRLDGDIDWIDLIHKDDITGEDGAVGANGVDGSPIQLRVYINQLQWKLTSEDNNQWKFLYDMGNLVIDIEVYLSSFVVADWVNDGDGYYSINFNHDRGTKIVNVKLTNDTYESVETYVSYIDINNSKITVPEAARFNGHVSISSGTVGVEEGEPITSNDIITALGYTPADVLQVAQDIADAQISVLPPKIVDLTFHTTYTLIPSDAGKILRIIANEGSTRTINIGNDIALLQPITFWREFSGTMIKQGAGDMVLSGQGVTSNQKIYDIGKYQTTVIAKFENNKVRIL